MRIPNPTKVLPQPRQLVDLTKRVAELMPGLPGRGGDERAAPPAPALKPKPQAAGKPKPKAKAAAKPRRPRDKLDQ
ncbi:MAG: hypothetical protein JJE35_10695 [Thermoleophilia bacterium]|nr:hypothetical protein [Thermoleophilia bacterium]